MNECPNPVQVRVLGKEYPRVLCGCGEHTDLDPSPESLQREVEEWLLRESVSDAETRY